ncbi:MAG: hypothetical protein NPIRA04_26240 [Nitrospirales bacterium]|nr:MAG: hypothetical protein NPIRA04_26240 [Nitrospirales bacterium]
MKSQSGGKGQDAEEALRAYFLSIGYFAVRSIPFIYRGFEVTDIDLWLYSKPSPITRERVNVDIKRKNTPKALERVFWTRGVKDVLALDRCIVATTDKRMETPNFGTRHGVAVLGGGFLQNVIRDFIPLKNRISEESFLIDLQENCHLKSGLVWKNFYKESKSLLINALNYNGCNLLLKKIKFLIEEILASDWRSSAALRLLYILSSYLLVTIDFLSRPMISYEETMKRKLFEEGFRFGEHGKKRAEEIIATVESIMTSVSGERLEGSSNLRTDFESQLYEYPAEILAEHFSKIRNLNELFSLSKKFESIAFNSELVKPQSLEGASRAFLGVLCDFYRIDRKSFI